MEWKDSLSIGIEAIDNQHKALFSAVNDLFDACGKGLGRKKIAETMKFLQNYVGTHFGDEERLQQQYGYPAYPEHKKLHEEFVRQFLAYKAQLEAEGPTISLVGQFNGFVSSWLLFHISREDKKLGDYINNKK